MTDPFYRTRAWNVLRVQALVRDGYTCVVPGCGQPAQVVDHIQARRAGGPDDLANLRSLCDAHDRMVKERPDGRRANGGKLTLQGCEADGTPRDPTHPWFKAR